MESRDTIKPGDRFKHYKGKTYKILGIGHHSETQEELVVYQGEYSDEEFGENPIWVRPLEMFVESVHIEGIDVPRFSRIEQLK